MIASLIIVAVCSFLLVVPFLFSLAMNITIDIVTGRIVNVLLYPGVLMRNTRLYRAYIILGTTIATFLPMVILTILSVLIIHKLRHGRIRSQRMNIMILVVLISFVVSRVPASVDLMSSADNVFRRRRHGRDTSYFRSAVYYTGFAEFVVEYRSILRHQPEVQTPTDEHSAHWCEEVNATHRDYCYNGYRTHASRIGAAHPHKASNFGVFIKE